MIVFPFALIGALYGAFLAFRRKGNTFDIAQYAVGFCIAFALIGLLASVVLDRLY